MPIRPLLIEEWKNLTYKEAWDKQQAYLSRLVEQKRGRNESDQILPHKLIFCHHHHVYTLGKSGSRDHLLLSENECRAENVEFYPINRGGDITYHGPGQLVVYPILDLDDVFTDIHKYVRLLEEVIIQLLTLYGIDSTRIEKYTGVWLPPGIGDDKWRKICAIGVHMSRWVSMHGLAFNVNTDLNFFDKIIPCGIQEKDKSVTSLSYELGENVDIGLVWQEFIGIFCRIFNFEKIEN